MTQATIRSDVRHWLAVLERMSAQVESACPPELPALPRTTPHAFSIGDTGDRLAQLSAALARTSAAMEQLDEELRGQAETALAVARAIGETQRKLASSLAAGDPASAPPPTAP